MASAICSASRAPAPSSSISAVRCATPNLLRGSAPLPALTTSDTWTTGTLCSSTIQTGSPFDNVRFWIAGSFNAGGGPGFGAAVRSGGLLRGSLACRGAGEDGRSGQPQRDNKSREQRNSACGPSEAPEGSGAKRRRRASATGGGAPRAIKQCERFHGHGFFTIGTTLSSTRLSAGSQNAAAA